MILGTVSANLKVIKMFKRLTNTLTEGHFQKCFSFLHLQCPAYFSFETKVFIISFARTDVTSTKDLTISVNIQYIMTHRKTKRDWMESNVC